MAESVYTIVPTFDPSGNVLSFSSNDLNVLVSTETVDIADPYQKLLGHYAYMTINKKGKFNVWRMALNSLMWKPATTCEITPGPGITMGKEVIEPCLADAAAQICADELLNSCFEGVLSWRNGEMDEGDYVTLVDELGRNFALSATLGAKMNLVMGQFYPNIDYTPNPADNIDMRTAFVTASNTCKGWVQGMVDLADNGYAAANNTTIFSCADFDGDRYTGDVLTVYDNAKLSASRRLRARLVHALNPALARRGFAPVILVSDTFFAAIVAQYNEQCLNPACINKRLGMAPYQYQGETWNLYTIDGIPVIPVPEVNEWDEHTTGNTHLFVITVTKNIQLGSSFDTLDGTSQWEISEAGIIVQRDPDIFKRGLYKMLSTGLFGVAFADPDLVSGAVQHCA